MNRTDVIVMFGVLLLGIWMLQLLKRRMPLADYSSAQTQHIRRQRWTVAALSVCVVVGLLSLLTDGCGMKRSRQPQQLPREPLQP